MDGRLEDILGVAVVIDHDQATFTQVDKQY